MAAKVKPARDEPDGVTAWHGFSEESLMAALSPPAIRCVEAGLIDRCDDDVLFAQHASGHLSLVVTTRSAYRHAIARTFIAAMASRTEFSEDLRERLYGAVQEALMNAILHGNLEVDPHLRDSLEGLLSAQQAIETRLALPQVSCAMIRLKAVWNASTLHVVIRDSGKGYDAAELPERKEGQSEESASGRGLDILKTFSDGVEVSNGGTTVKLEFRR
jgi:anti-sigma regulatory factor (Ser/Thr protein kinase)